MNVIKFKQKTTSSSTKEAKKSNVLNIKMRLMANLTDLLHEADEEYHDLTKGALMTCTSHRTGNVYEITIKRVKTNG